MQCFSKIIDEMKAMLFMTFIIQPWPPDDFGTLVDSQTFVEYDLYATGIQVDAFRLYTKAIFGKDILQGANFTPKVSNAHLSVFNDLSMSYHCIT
jgi:hypothetical protein